MRRITLAGILVCLASDSFASGTYYVDGSNPGCSNSGSGTTAQPYCSISAAVAARGAPGTTILVQPGVYAEQVTLVGSGLPNQNFVLQAPQGGVVVDGADDYSDPAAWVQHAGDVWLAAGVTWSPIQVFADGSRLTASSEAPESLPAGSFHWEPGAGLYVNAGGGNPADHHAQVGHRAHGIVVDQRTWVTVDGFTVTRTEDSGIDVSGSYLVLTHNSVERAGKSGIDVAGGFGTQLGSNTLSDNGEHGIALSGGASGCTLEDNEASANASNGIQLDGSYGNTLRRNRLHDNQGTGLQLQSASNNCVSDLNRSWNNASRGFSDVASTGTLHVGEVAFGNALNGFWISDNATGTRIYDSIATDNGTAAAGIDLQIDATSTLGFASSDNVFWNASGQAPVRYAGASYPSLAAYQAASGQDARTLEADPRFVDAAAGDFRLQAGSPAIDSGNSGVSGWPTSDAAGNARMDDRAIADTGIGPVTYSDRGALEYMAPDYAPVVTAPATAAGAEGSALTVNVTAADVDGDAITSLTVANLPAGATFTPGTGNTGGTLSWTPGYDQAGSHTLTFVAANALSGSASTVITVANVDRPPTIAVPAEVFAAEAHPVSILVHATDPDAQSDPLNPARRTEAAEMDGGSIPTLTADLSGLPAGATFTADPGSGSGTLSWTPGYDDAGSYTVRFTASNVMTATSSTVINVSNTDRAPVVEAPGTASASEGQPFTLAVHAADPDGQPLGSLIADLSSLPPGAEFTADPGDSTGTVSWTPGYDDAGSYTVSFSAANALWGASSTTIHVSNTDRSPAVTAPAAVSVSEESPLALVVHAADPDGDPVSSLAANLSGLPDGMKFIAGAGNTSGTLTWTPSFVRAGTYTVTFTAANALSGRTSTVITVADSDRPPTIMAPATVSTAEARRVEIAVNVSDPDGKTAIAPTGSRVDAEGAAGETIASLTATGLPPGATFTADPGNLSGKLSWTPSYDEAGSYTVSFTAANSLSATTHSVIDVSNVDRAPVVSAPQTATAHTASPLTVRVHAADPDGQPLGSLTADLTGLPPGASFTPEAGDTAGTLSWIPGAGDIGSYTVRFTAANGLSVTAVTAITVYDTDRAPQVTVVPTISVFEGSPLTLDVQAADPDGEPIAALTADLSSLPPGATFTPSADHTRGTLSWRPGYDQAGTYTVSFTAANALSGSAGTVITVEDVDRAPIVIVPSTVNASEGKTVTIAVHASDPDGEPIQSLLANVAGLPPESNAVFTADPGDTTGTFTWTPTFDDAGKYVVAFEADNALAGASTTFIIVSNTDRAPVLVAPPIISVFEAKTLTFTVHAADPDDEPFTSLTATGLPPGAQFTPAPGDTSGILSWTPGYDDAGLHSITFTATNGATAKAATTINVKNTDRAPVIAASATLPAAEGNPFTLTVHVSDPDGDPITMLTFDGSRLPAGSNAVFTRGPGDSTGVLTWTPAFDQAGSYPVTIYTGNRMFATASAVIQVVNTDRAPVVTAPPVASVSETAPLTIDVTAADPDGDPIQSLSANLAALPAGATFIVGPGNASGTLSWTPGLKDAGSYSVIFTAANALSGSASTTVTVSNLDRAPVIVAPATAFTTEGKRVSVTVHASDVDNDPITTLSADLSVLPAGNDAVFTPDPGDTTGTLTWTPTYLDAGFYTVNFTAANAMSATTSTVISVTNVDRPPVVTAPATVSSPEGAPLVVTVQAVDPDGQPVSLLVADLTSAPGATFVASPDKSSGTLTWTPGYATAGNHLVTFFAAAAGKSATASTMITVTNTDRAPIVSAPATASVSETGTLSLTVHAADPDGEAITSLSAGLAGLPAGNDAVFTPGPGDSTGTLTWTPTYDDAGSHTITFTAANALSGSGNTVVTVTNRDRAPSLAAPATAGVEGTPLTLTVHASDIDGDPITSLTASLSGLPSGNDAVFTPGPGDSTGTLTWTPTYDDAGSYTVSFTAGNALSASTSAVITVANADRPPTVVAPATGLASEADAFTLVVHAADLDGQPVNSLTADLSGLPAGNNAVFTPGPGDTTGTLTWTPTYNDAGSYTVSFTVANALSGSASTKITVIGTDRPPTVAAPAAASVAELGTVTVTVHAADIDGDAITALTADLSQLPAGNHAVFTAGPGDSTGTLTWTPTYDDAGSHTITFTAANALSGSASTVITVTNVDRAPVIAAPATVTVGENAALDLTIHAADLDGDAIATLVADLSALPAGNDAAFTLGPGDTTATLHWTPAFGTTGSYAVTFFATNALSATATTVINVSNTDRAPLVAVPAIATGAETKAFTLTVHAADPDGEPLGSLVANLGALPAGNDAVFTADPGDSTGTLTWTPSYADSGSYTVTFTAANALSGSASTVIHIANTDRAPSITAISTSGVEGSPITVAVHASDIDGDPITSLTAMLAGLPAGHNAVFSAGPGDTTGTLTWTPTYNDAGTYTVFFIAGNALSATGSADITVANTDRAPVVSAPATAMGSEADALTLTVHAADPDGQPLGSLTANLSGLPAGHNAVFSADPGDSTGTLTWTPTYADAGSYTVTFTAANGLTGSASTKITVIDTDRAPTIVAPAAATTPEAGAVTITVHASDIDGQPIASLTANLAGLPAGNDAVFTPGPGDTTGTFTWTPSYADAGSHTVTFTAANAMSASTSTVITVTNVDREPVIAAPATVSVAEGSKLAITVHAADPDADPIQYLVSDLSSLPAGNDAVFTVNPGDTSATLTWTPAFDTAGKYVLTFFASNALSATTSTVVTVTNTDRAPVVDAPEAWFTTEGEEYTLKVAATDPDGEPIGSFSADLSGLPAGNNAVFTPDAGNTSGTLTWTPTYQDADAGSYFVTFTASNALSGTFRMPVLVFNIDREPVVTAPAAAAVLENEKVTVTVHALDPDHDAFTLTADLSTLPAGNDAVFTPGPGDTTGTLTWTPSYNDAGTYNVSFSAANDMKGAASTVITVGNVDRPPVLTVPAAISSPEAAPLALTVLAADPDGQPITSLIADLSGLPAGATFTLGANNASGTLDWTPGYNESGRYIVTFFTLSGGLSETVSTVITITNSDRAPVVSASAATVAETGSLTLTMHAADPDGDAITSLTANLAGLPAGHDALFTPGPGDTTGTLTWTPTYSDSGHYTVAFTAGNALSGSGSTVITVTNVDRAPSIVAPAATVAEGSALTLVVHAADVDGDPITSLGAFLAGLPAGNNAVFTPGPGDTTGTLTWTPTYDDAGKYSIFFTVDNALSATAVTEITVTNTDRAPVVSVPATAFGSEADAFTLVVHAADPDGQPLSSLVANLSGLPAGNNAVFTPGPGDTTGTLSWTPSYNHAGNYTVSFTAANALTGSASTAITVINTDRPPAIAGPAAASIAENNQVTIVVHASDIDGEPITSLTADVSGLPTGNNAVFTPGPADTVGTLRWTPTYDDAGSYTVTFSAGNAMSASTSTAITVTNVDRPPVLGAPPTASGVEGQWLVLTITSTDPDGQPINSLLADLTNIPGATFLLGPGNESGTLTWKPAFNQAGTYTVSFFTGSGGLSATATTVITINNSDRAPIVAAPATVSVAETGVLALTVHAADPDGDAVTSLSAGLAGLPAGNNAVFTPGPGDTTGTLTWTPTYDDAGSYNITFTAGNVLSGSGTTKVTVTNTDRAPTIAAPAASVAEGSALTLTVHAADIDGDAITSLTANLSGLPGGNNAVFTPGPGDTTGTLSWTPTYDDAGSYPVTFTAGNALSASTIAVITVTNTDRAPVVAVPATVPAAEAAALTLVVHAADPDGQPLSSLSANLAGLPAGNNAVFTPGPGDTTGTLTWTPTYSNAGSYTVTFTAGNALSGSSSATIVVANTDRAPTIAAPAAASVAEASKVTVLVHAADIDGEPITSLTANVSGLPAGNNAVFTAGPADSTGTFTWTPTFDDAGSYTVTFTAGNALSSSASTAILVTNVDRPPVVVAPPTVSSPEGTTLVLTVSASDPDGQAITSLLADLSGLPPGATFVDGPGNTTGTLTWTPSYTQAGSYTVRFFAGAGGLSGTANTTITITNTDRAPLVATPAAVSVAENGFLSLTVHAADPDGQAVTALTANLASLPFGNNAVFTPGPGDTTGTLTWTPTYQDAGSYSVTFTAANVLSGSGSTVITVTNTDRAPAIAAPAASGAENTVITLTVHAADIDGDAITSLTAHLTGLPFGNNAVFTPGPGDTTGTLTWTPTYNDAGAYTVSFTAANALSASASAVITVTPGDRPPFVSAPASDFGSEADAFTLTVHAADPDGDAITSFTANLSGLPGGSNAVFTPGPGDTTGTLTWTPTYNDAGTYTVSFTAGNALSGSASTSITVIETDRPPTIAAPASASIAEASPITVHVHAADVDGNPITSLTANLLGLPAGNNAVFTPGPADTTGTLTWTPTYNDAGSYTVSFTAGNAMSASTSTVITVTNVDRPPVITAPPTVSSPEGTPLAVAVTAADPDGQPIDVLVADLSDLPAGATFTPAAGNASGTLNWTPNASQDGIYIVSFFATAGSLPATATTVITITHVDHAPVVAAPANVSVTENSALSVTVHAADPDADAITSLAANLTSLPAGNNAVFTPGPGDTTGTLTWTPTYADSGLYTISFTAANGASGSASSVIKVINFDRTPVIAAPATVSVAEGGSLSFTIHAADPDGDVLIGLAANLSALPEGDASFEAGDGDSTGVLTWNPTFNDAGSYTVVFAAIGTSTGTASTKITVTNADQPPIVAAPAAVSVAGGDLLQFTVHAADPDGDALTSLNANLSSLPGSPSFTADPGDTTGTLSWTTAPADTGVYLVTFTAGNALSGSAITSITVSGPSTLPLANRVPVPALSAEDRLIDLGASGGSWKVQIRASDRNGSPSMYERVVLGYAGREVEAAQMARMGGGELDAIFGGNDLRGLFAGLSPARQTVTVTVSGARGNAVTSLGTLPVEVMGAPAPMHPIVTPNPMRTQSVISFATTQRAPLRVDLFDATGRRVRRLAEDAAATAGWHAITVDGRDDRGAALPAGMYFYRVVADNRAVNGRLVLIK